MTNSKFLTRELKENPEFYKAFPHLAAEDYNEETKRIVDRGIKEPFFQSLQNQYANYLKPIDNEELNARENELNFVQANHAHVEGPHKYMTKEEKLRVHLEVDTRLQELEATGLSRVELLFDDMEGKGQNLKDDPFFQLVKSSRVVREMMITPGGEFTADRVIELTLRQDFGPDPSMSGLKQRLKMSDDSSLQPIHEYKKKYRDQDPLFNAEHHFTGANFVEKQERLAQFASEKPATFINRPLSRGQLRKKVMRSVVKNDIDWRNMAFITKFLNPSGKLYNRYQTRLETVVHRRVQKTVKKMRHLGLIPFVGQITPTDKIPLGSFIDDVEEMHKKTIDPVTGRMFLRHSLQDDARDKARRAARKADSRTSDFADYAIEETSEQEQLRGKIIREMSLDSQHLVPNAAQREWLSAQAYLLKSMGALKEMKGIKENDGKEFIDIRDDFGPAGVKSAYNNVKTRVLETSDDTLKTGEGLISSLLHEKSHELSKFSKKVKTPKDKLLEGNWVEATEKDEDQIRAEIKRLMSDNSDNLQNDFHVNESVNKRGRRVNRPRLLEPHVI